jgi:hypothetical protein
VCERKGERNKPSILGTCQPCEIDQNRNLALARFCRDKEIKVGGGISQSLRGETIFDEFAFKAFIRLDLKGKRNSIREGMDRLERKSNIF